jgi:hypothetical protein
MVDRLYASHIHWCSHEPEEMFILMDNWAAPQPFFKKLAAALFHTYL